MQFNCPKCGQKLTLTSSKPGDWLDCPACEATIQVPGASAPPKPTPRAAKPLAAGADNRAEPAKSLWADKRVQFGALAGVVGLLLIALFVVLIEFHKPNNAPEQVRNDPPPVEQPAPVPVAPAPPAPVTPVALPAPVKPKDDTPAPPKPKDDTPPPPKDDDPPKPVTPPKPAPDYTKLDQFGNPIDHNTGLGQKDEFKGQRLLFWGATNIENGFGPENPLWKAFEEKGFVLQKEFGPFKPEWLKKADQLWILSGQNASLQDADYDAIVTFVKSGKGLCLLADNDPFYFEANQLTKRLFDVQISGNYPGTQIAYVNRKQLTPEQIRKYGGQYEVPDHPLLTGVNFVYEGITISHVDQSDKFDVALRASDKQSLVVTSKVQGLRVVIDCGFTRYYSSFIPKTAGTTRLAQNMAAYLARKETPKKP
jgi:hypothetical protein